MNDEEKTKSEKEILDAEKEVLPLGQPTVISGRNDQTLKAEELKAEKEAEELDRLEGMVQTLEQLDSMTNPQSPEDLQRALESMDTLKKVMPFLASLQRPKEQYNHVSYSAKLAISKYQNHQISFGKRVPVNGDYYEAFAEVMTKTYNFHEAILAFRHLSQHVIGLKSERRTILGHISRTSDEFERHKAQLIALTEKAPGTDEDILKQAEHQKNLLCEREGLDDKEKRLKDLKVESMDLWNRIVKYTDYANELGVAIKAGKPESWDHLPEQFKIPLDEGHKKPEYITQKGLSKQYYDYADDEY